MLINNVINKIMFHVTSGRAGGLLLCCCHILTGKKINGGKKRGRVAPIAKIISALAEFVCDVFGRRSLRQGISRLAQTQSS